MDYNKLQNIYYLYYIQKSYQFSANLLFLLPGGRCAASLSFFSLFLLNEIVFVAVVLPPLRLIVHAGVHLEMTYESVTECDDCAASSEVPGQDQPRHVVYTSSCDPR